MVVERIGCCSCHAGCWSCCYRHGLGRCECQNGRPHLTAVSLTAEEEAETSSIGLRGLHPPSASAQSLGNACCRKPNPTKHILQEASREDRAAAGFLAQVERAQVERRVQVQRWVQVMAPTRVAVMKDQVEVAKQVVEIVVAEMVVGIVAECLPSRLRRAHPKWIG